MPKKKFGIGRREVPKDETEKLVRSWLLSEHEFRQARQKDMKAGFAQMMIIETVIKHDGRNSPNDSLPLIVLMDADRVVNLGVDNIIRSGQLHNDLPAVDYKNWLSDAEVTYRNPKSALFDIACSLEWADPTTPVCVRTRLGKKLAGERVDAYKGFIDTLKQQLEQEGIIPYPFG